MVRWLLACGATTRPGIIGDVEVVCLQHESFLLTETELIVDNLGVPSIRIQKCEV